MKLVWKTLKIHENCKSFLPQKSKLCYLQKCLSVISWFLTASVSTSVVSACGKQEIKLEWPYEGAINVRMNFQFLSLPSYPYLSCLLLQKLYQVIAIVISSFIPGYDYDVVTIAITIASINLVQLGTSIAHMYISMGRLLITVTPRMFSNIIVYSSLRFSSNIFIF